MFSEFLNSFLFCMLVKKLAIYVSILYNLVIKYNAIMIIQKTFTNISYGSGAIKDQVHQKYMRN